MMGPLMRPERERVERKIRSASETAGAMRWALWTHPKWERVERKIRSVSDGCERGWGPARE